MTLSTHKNIAVIIAIFVISAFSSTAQSKKEIDHYVSLNEKEIRMADYKDSREMIIQKLKQVEYINKSRKAYNAPPVKLDILASRVANQICVEGAKNGFMGHFGLNGSTPFLRYAAAGGTDHVSENASSVSSTMGIASDENTTAQLMIEMHDKFMAEKAPNDGHKQTCIDQNHNYVGIGCATINGEFRYYEEFIDRYLIFKPIVTTSNRKKPVSLSFKPISNDHVPYCIMAFYVPKPRKMTPAQINRTNSYKDFSSEVETTIWKPDMPKSDSEGYTNINFTFRKKGYYYIKIYLDEKSAKQNKMMTTKGKIEASGVVIDVN